jgi:hypothetical protein
MNTIQRLRAGRDDENDPFDPGDLDLDFYDDEPDDEEEDELLDDEEFDDPEV